MKCENTDALLFCLEGTALCWFRFAKEYLWHDEWSDEEKSEFW